MERRWGRILRWHVFSSTLDQAPALWKTWWETLSFKSLRKTPNSVRLYPKISTTRRGTPRGGALKLWNNFLAAKFEKTPESSRVAYILLDGVDLLDEADLQDLLDLFQDLGCDKTALQIMMTTSFPEKLKLVERRKERGDIPKIIEHRIKSMNNLKGFSKENHNKILEQLASQSDGKSQNFQ